VVPVESSYRPLYELLLVIYSNFRLTIPVSEIQAILMLKTTFLPTPLYLTLNLKVMQLECEEIWRQITKIMGQPYMVKKS